jgi:hypothetical protein
MALFFDASVKQRLGRKDVLTKYNRFFGDDRGYKGRLFRSTARPLLPGAFVLSRGGAFYGFATYEKRYDSILRDDTRFGRPGVTAAEARDATKGVRTFTFRAMMDSLVSPKPEVAFDQRVKVKGVQERKELAWLGVEFQPMSPELAGALDVGEHTRDGRLGLLVTLVHEGSPAAALGIGPHDILLTIKPVGMAGDRPLQLPANYDYRNTRINPEGRGGAYVDRNWFNRRNALTQYLTTLGVGTPVEITYCSAADKKVETATFSVEKAPPDLASAEKVQSAEMGLAVKDITYEVRSLLQLGPEYRGVIVYEVESGSPAALGRIQPMQFITEIDGRPVEDAADFRRVVADLLAQGRASARVKVSSLDESRFVEVKFESETKAP